MKHEGDDNTNFSFCSGDNLQKIGKRIERPVNERTRRDDPDNSNDKIGQNTENSPGNLWRLIVSQTSVRNYQLTLVW